MYCSFLVQCMGIEFRKPINVQWKKNMLQVLKSAASVFSCEFAIVLW